MKKKIIVLSGAGMSAESGIKTFRDSNGLWEGHDIIDVATPEGWQKNPQLVLDFYNQRRKQLKEVSPNLGHLLLSELEKKFDVQIITQNVDNLHEKAGSSNVLHLHGELLKVRCTQNENDIYQWEEDLKIGDLNKEGHQLRPHIVWFGEEVPNLLKAAKMTEQADILIIIGTSLQVYPAAGLINYSKPNIPIFYIDPKPSTIKNIPNKIKTIAKTASKGLKILIEELEEI